MTTQAEELLGAQLTGADGKEIGTVEQVFGDDASGAPAWARIRSGKQTRFVPLGNAHVGRDGLSVPFDSEQISSGPKIDVDTHISAEQADELNSYYTGLEPAEEEQRSSGADRRRSDRPHVRNDDRPQARNDDRQQARHEDRPRPKAEPPQPRAESQQRGKKSDDEWILRREERLHVGKESAESGRVKLHRYVETEPVEQTVRLAHEEFDVEREPVSQSEPVGDDFSEDEREITLHEEQGFMSKQTVPVERMRLVTNRVEEDQTFRDDIRRERIEVEPEPELATAGGRRGKAR